MDIWIIFGYIYSGFEISFGRLHFATRHFGGYFRKGGSTSVEEGMDY